jgi:hypothetical protein
MSAPPTRNAPSHSRRKSPFKLTGGYSRYYTEADVISAESLPGLSIPVAAFFQDLAEIR